MEVGTQIEPNQMGKILWNFFVPYIYYDYSAEESNYDSRNIMHTYTQKHKGANLAPEEEPSVCNFFSPLTRGAHINHINYRANGSLSGAKMAPLAPFMHK